MTSVVIVGSGFTGFECARRLSRQLRKNNASVGISIISPVDYMLYTPLLPDVTGVTGAPLIEELGLPTQHGRLKVQANLQVPDHPDVFAAGDAAAVPDLTQPGTITPPTPHSTPFGRERCWRATSPPASVTGKPKDYRHRNMGLVVDLGPHHAVANPLNVQLSGCAAIADRRVLRPIRRLHGVVHPGRRAILDQ